MSPAFNERALRTPIATIPARGFSSNRIGARGDERRAEIVRVLLQRSSPASADELAAIVGVSHVRMHKHLSILLSERRIEQAGTRKRNRLWRAVA